MDKPGFPIIDGHVDLIYEMMRHHHGTGFRDLAAGPVTLEKMVRGNVRVIVTALYSPDSMNGEKKARAHLEGLLDYADSHLQGIKQVTSEKDLFSCYDSDLQPGTLFLVENADALLEMDLDRLLMRKIKVIGLTHAGRNRIGDGNSVHNPRGLTGEGKNLVRRLVDKGFILDVAHLSDPSFRDVLKLFDGPLISSHTGFRFFVPKPRNLGEEEIKRIAERKGIIGVSVNPEMLSMDNIVGIHDVFRHIDWIVQRYGPDIVAIGSDYCGFDCVNQGMKDISCLKDLEDIMAVQGYPEEAIKKILGWNWYLFYSSLLDVE